MRETDLFALVPDALAEADRLASEGKERERRRGFPAPCGKGCDACCRYLVRVSVPEATHLRKLIRGLAPGRREEVERRFKAARRTLTEAGLREELEEGLVRRPGDLGFDHRAESLARRYLELSIPCPFLDLAKRACSIHPERPAPCRQYLVTSDPAQCVDPFTNNTRSISMRRLVRDDLVKKTAAMTGEPERMIALTLI